MPPKRPSPALLERAVAAVRAGAHGDGPLCAVDAFCIPQGEDLAVYLDDLRPADLPAGGIYRTFIVRFRGQARELAGVSFYRTRIEPDGSHKTLPP